MCGIGFRCGWVVGVCVFVGLLLVGVSSRGCCEGLWVEVFGSSCGVAGICGLGGDEVVLVSGCFGFSFSARPLS